MKRLLTSICIFYSLFANSQSDRELRNLEAFGKVYGYVKYFHPSDEAYNLDWDKFATFGSGQVINATNDSMLVVMLEDLFHPIAPTVNIFLSKEARPFDINTLTPVDLKGYKPTYWQHSGLGFGTRNDDERPYLSIRVNREVDVDESADFGNIMTQLEAEKYRGKKFRYAAMIKTDKNTSGSGHLWFRVDKDNGKIGFFSNMNKNPINDTIWQRYRIEGAIDRDAKNISFGCFLNGEGTLYIDQIKFEIYDNEKWSNIQLKNNGFEDEKILNKSNKSTWVGLGKGYKISVENETVYEGKFSAKISYEGLFHKEKGEALFDKRVDVGELIEKELVNGISCQIPLALYASKENTYPLNKREAENLSEKIKTSSTAVSNRDARFSNVIIVYNVFQHFYPYFDVVEIDWGAEFLKALRRSYNDISETNHISTLEQFMAPLDDGHIGVYGKSYLRSVPDFRWEWVENQLIITEILDTNLYLNVGDQIESIEGVSPESYFDSLYVLISASTIGNKKDKAYSRGLMGNSYDSLTIEVNETTQKLARTHNYWNWLFQQKELDSGYEYIEEKIIYINLDVVSIDTIVTMLPRIERCSAIIFDLRGYPNGNHGVISLLLSKNDTNKSWMQIPQYLYPNQEGKYTFHKEGWELKAEKPYLGDKKIVFITDGSAISYAESFMGFIEGYELATIVGQPTAGTNGNVNSIELNGSIFFQWTGMRVYKLDGTLLHGVGITPDVYVEKTIKGVKAGRDEFLEKAIEIAKE